MTFVFSLREGAFQVNRVFRKVTELVDKDVASGIKPISLLGMGIPFVPFIILHDGAPVDSYPVLSGLAFAASIGWGLFVMWRMVRHVKSETRKRGRVDRLIQKGMMRRFRRGEWLPVIRRKK